MEIGKERIDSFLQQIQDPFIKDKVEKVESPRGKDSSQAIAILKELASSRTLAPVFPSSKNIKQREEKGITLKTDSNKNIFLSVDQFKELEKLTSEMQEKATPAAFIKGQVGPDHAEIQEELEAALNKTEDKRPLSEKMLIEGKVRQYDQQRIPSKQVLEKKLMQAEKNLNDSKGSLDDLAIMFKRTKSPELMNKMVQKTVDIFDSMSEVATLKDMLKQKSNILTQDFLSDLKVKRPGKVMDYGIEDFGLEVAKDGTKIADEYGEEMIDMKKQSEFLDKISNEADRRATEQDMKETGATNRYELMWINNKFIFKPNIKLYSKELIQTKENADLISERLIDLIGKDMKQLKQSKNLKNVDLDDTMGLMARIQMNIDALATLNDMRGKQTGLVK